jgi:hypothetical protein
MRHRWSLFVAVSLAAVLAACGGSGGGGAATGSPTDAPPVDAPAPTEPPAAGAPTDAAPGGQPAGGGEIPALADGLWSGGTFKADFGGTHPLSVEAPLTAGTSITSGGFTSLFYSLGTQPDLTVVQFVLDPATGGAINFTSPTVLVAGGPAEGCVTTVDKNDASGIAGTFTCPDMPGMLIGSNDEVRNSVNATWSAER